MDLPKEMKGKELHVEEQLKRLSKRKMTLREESVETNTAMLEYMRI